MSLNIKRQNIYENKRTVVLPGYQIGEGGKDKAIPVTGRGCR
jgi:hypothetical protein